MRRLIAVCLLANIAVASQAAQLDEKRVTASAGTTNADRAPTLTVERYLEDWSHLARTGEQTGRWTEGFKYIPLREDGAIYVTTGMEARSRYEAYQNVNWGAGPDDGYVWHRFMPYADLHAGSIRVFAQPIVTALSGAHGRPRTPVDSTGADMLQAFAEVEADLAEGTSLRVSVGRKLLSLGAGRFVSTRYGPGIPQGFDGVDATVTGATRQVRAFYLRPVDTAKGDFDDRASRQKSAWGIYTTHWLDGGRSFGVDAYYLGLRDRKAVYDQGTGNHIIHTFGTRAFGDTGSWHWNLEAAVQRGTFAGRRSLAWGIATEVGYRFSTTPLRPTLHLAADMVSGDRHRDDSRLGTFNPMFPNGKFLGALTPIGPRNLIHAKPSAAIHPRPDMQISLAGASFWRQSTDDGVYSVPGQLLRSGAGSDARFIGKQLELAIAWQATPEFNLSASASVFDPGSFIRDTGSSRPIRMVSTMANFRF